MKQLEGDERLPALLVLDHLKAAVEAKDAMHVMEKASTKWTTSQYLTNRNEATDLMAMFDVASLQLLDAVNSMELMVFQKREAVSKDCRNARVL